MKKIINAFSVDLEDWFQVLEHNDVSRWDHFESRIERNGHRLLEILAFFNVKATFFVLGYIAERNPHLIKLIHQSGHEIGSHGYTHTQVFRLTPEQFNAEIVRTNNAIGEITGKRPIGFRAPIFSIVGKSDWALDVLLDNGFKYDSSVFPAFTYRYGFTGANRFRHEIATRSGRSITEIPVATSKLLGMILPIGGGAYFRFWPYFITRWGLMQLNKQSKPAVFYIHPWEIDPDQPKIDMPKRIYLTHYHRLASTGKKLERLLADFKFTSVSEAFDIQY
jgi:polysaccharide deacetylase family protein (PEP-CTERM system associated)